MQQKLQKTDAEWQAELPPERFNVLRRAGTERAGSGALLHNTAAGTYRCGACGQQLFDASAKYDSHCGWPSFTEPQTREHVILRQDRTHGMTRTEVLCARCESHLGHVFDDGPGPSGERYCMNSLALDFAPVGGGKD